MTFFVSSLSSSFILLVMSSGMAGYVFPGVNKSNRMPPMDVGNEIANHEKTSRQDTVVRILGSPGLV